MTNFKVQENEKARWIISICICEVSTSKTKNSLAFTVCPELRPMLQELKIFKFVGPFSQKSNLNKKNLELDPSLMLKLPSSFSWISLEQVMHSGAKTDEKSSSLVSSFKKHQPH